jgi:hypothetical protein
MSNVVAVGLPPSVPLALLEPLLFDPVEFDWSLPVLFELFWSLLLLAFEELDPTPVPGLLFVLDEHAAIQATPVTPRTVRAKEIGFFDMSGSLSQWSET